MDVEVTGPAPNRAGDVDEWELLARVGRGDDAAFRTLVELHQDRIVRHCERLLGNRESGLDAAQEVFLKTYRKAATLRRKGQLYTWLYRVATNHCLNELRRARIVRFFSLTRSTGEAVEAVVEPLDDGPDALVALETKERWDATRAGIAALPAGQRAVLLLAKFEGLSYREIAAALEISVSAVESRLFRAMRSLEKAQDSAGRTVTRRRET